ncbi:PREDICTED: ubiquitin carboxyl-terminal hydrolase 20-like [Ipomoea nil]|uniref:ubiquitin carboxyl-terminal hydrolase 20-like n=1 Tax=Ipomoea nil TaxID=35883 RepID=UPI000901788D|nr:PREDICTED: ubiquitin carboxyl-terminal hydrolase 20-like [Ipomoea nil]
METHSSETLETQNCPDPPKNRALSPVTSPAQAPAATGTSPDFDDLIDWDDEMEKEDLQDGKHFFVGGGLSNLGNTCFLNAVLQCFMHTVPVLKGLQASNHPSPCDGYIEGFCALCALKELIDIFLATNSGVVSPWKLVNNLNYFSSGFQRYQQEDAHEFLQCFLDRLESCCDGNFVKQTFGGRLISKLWCCNCGHCSDTYEPLIDLSLEIEDVDSIPAALESFTRVENIEDPETMFTCENCKEQVLIKKQLLLDEVPTVATFHLKRFKNDGSVVEKIDKHVAFPLELDLLPYAEKNHISNGDSKYCLYAIVVHNGFSSCSGHYYCFIRSASDAWYKFDDSKVSRVREEFVMSQEAYILFYAKQGTPWFSDFIETQKLIMPSTSPKSVLDNEDVVSCNPPGMSSRVAADMVASPVRFNGVTHERVEEESLGNENETPLMMPTKTLDVCSPEATMKMASPSLQDSKRQKIGVPKQRVLDLIPTTPPRSPSPEIYRQDSPENVYCSIPRPQHSRTGSCKRQLEKNLESEERKQAMSAIKKNMRGSRAQQLMAALRGSRSEGSANKKSRRMESSSSSPIKHTRPIIANTLR